MITLRDYQHRAIASVRGEWQAGRRRVVCVVPTGGGKTTIGAELSKGHGRAVWLAHRIELVEQAAERLRAQGHDVGIVSPRHAPDPWATTQVASLDTLVSRGQAPPADCVVLDECHHAAAATYAEVLRTYPNALHLGLTATPQRADGRALGDHYDALVVGAQYSELLAAGHLVPCRVRRPAEPLGSDLARDPIAEWQEHGGGRQTFAFARTVELAHDYARQMRERGIASEAIDGAMPARERAAALERFRDGATVVLWNVHVLTEGVDVPAASCCLLARGTTHASTCLQMVGRVLRPAPGKAHAVLLDLPGVTHLHGLPTADREYALAGKAIAVVGAPLRNCPACGACYESAPVCPVCGYEAPPAPRAKPKIFDLELSWAIDEAGGDPAAVGDEWRRREWDRLMHMVATREKWSVAFARREYAALFGADPPAAWLAEVPGGIAERELARLRAVARERGYRDGWVAHRYRATFGRWPRKAG